MLASKLLSSIGNTDKLYVDDVFSAYTYTGNGSTQTINNGIDLAGKGGMVWIKSRSATSHCISDSERPSWQYRLSTNTMDAQVIGGQNPISSVGSSSFVIGLDSSGQGWNYSGETYVSWTFRKAQKFFDVVTYTGNGVAGRQITHSLGVAPGMVIVKKTSSAGDWCVWHRSIATQLMYLNYTNAQTGDGANTFETFSENKHTATAFGIGGSSSQINTNGVTYVAYLFAHDPSADGIVQCGSFTTNGSGNATVNHGWSTGVQFAKIKTSSTTGDWEIFDSSRSPAWSTDQRLRANLSNAEDTVTRLSASGTSISFTGLSASQTYVYIFVVAPT